MKNLIIANSLLTAASAPTMSAAAAFTANKVTVQSVVDDPLIFVGGRGANISPDIFRIERKNMSWVKTAASNAANFSVTFTVALVEGYDYQEARVSIFKKGAVFNERNVWTISAHGSVAATVAAKLAKNINVSAGTHGLTATVDGAAITLTGGDYSDYEVELFKTGVGTATDKYATTESAIAASSVTHGTPGVGTPEYMKNLIMSCIGAKGLDSTYIDGAPNGSNESDYFTGKFGLSGNYNIYTIRYYNPRYDHNKDEQLNAVLHIAVSTSITDSETSGEPTPIADFEKALNNQSLS